MINEPSPNGSNGQDSQGRFRPGNKLGKGNPMASHVNRIRVALLRSVKPSDVKAIIVKLVADAKEGNLGAAKEILTRTLGEPLAPDILERLENLEQLVKKESDHAN
jgi:hypothetical protein